MPEGSVASDGWGVAVDELRAWGVERVFGLPGDDMLALAALRREGIELVLMRSQRAAVFAAAAQSLVTQAPAVAVVGRGPAAAAALPAVLEAAAQGARLLLLAGGAPIGGAHPHTFQYVPQLDLLRPVCRIASRPETAGETAFRVGQALLVIDGPAGGVAYVEIADPGLEALSSTPRQAQVRLQNGAVSGSLHAPELVRRARRPLVVIGGGCRRLPRGAIERWARESGAGILTTASGRGIVSEADERFLGLSGLYAPADIGALMRRADLIIALGTRLEETATFGWPAATPVVHVDLDPVSAVLNRPGVFVQADVAHVLTWAEVFSSEPGWAEEIAQVRASARTWAAGVRSENVVAETVGCAVESLPPGSVICQENGLMDIWSYLHPVTIVPDGVEVVAPSELTTLGAGCVGALGARYPAQERGGIVLAIVGDGAFGSVADDIEHAPASGSGVVILVLDNGGFGWLEQQNRVVNGESGVFVSVGGRGHEGAVSSAASRDTGEAVARAIAEVAPGEIRVVRIDCAIEAGPPLT